MPVVQGLEVYQGYLGIVLKLATVLTSQVLDPRAHGLFPLCPCTSESFFQHELHP